MGHQLPSSPTWSDRLALSAARWPCASRRACRLPSCPLCSPPALCVWSSSLSPLRSHRLLIAAGPWGPLPPSRDLDGHQCPQEAQKLSSPPAGGFGPAGLAAGHTGPVPSRQLWRDPGVPNTHSHSVEPAMAQRRSRPGARCEYTSEKRSLAAPRHMLSSWRPASHCRSKPWPGARKSPGRWSWPGQHVRGLRVPNSGGASPLQSS